MCPPKDLESRTAAADSRVWDQSTSSSIIYWVGNYRQLRPSRWWWICNSALWKETAHCSELRLHLKQARFVFSALSHCGKVFLFFVIFVPTRHIFKKIDFHFLIPRSTALLLSLLFIPAPFCRFILLHFASKPYCI